MILFQFTTERGMFSGLKLFALAARDTVPGTDRVRGVLFFEAGGGDNSLKYTLLVCLLFVCIQLTSKRLN